MKYFKNFLLFFSLLIIVFLIAPPSLYAYIDGGTGSYIIQILIAVAVGGAFGIKIFWRRIYGFFKRQQIKANKRVKINDK